MHRSLKGFIFGKKHIKLHGMEIPKSSGHTYSFKIQVRADVVELNLKAGNIGRISIS
jgi:hypothetical protein